MYSASFAGVISANFRSRNEKLNTVLNSEWSKGPSYKFSAQYSHFQEFLYTASFAGVISANFRSRSEKLNTALDSAWSKGPSCKF